MIRVLQQNLTEFKDEMSKATVIMGNLTHSYWNMTDNKKEIKDFEDLPNIIYRLLEFVMKAYEPVCKFDHIVGASAFGKSLLSRWHCLDFSAVKLETSNNMVQDTLGNWNGMLLRNSWIKEEITVGILKCLEPNDKNTTCQNSAVQLKS